MMAGLRGGLLPRGPVIRHEIIRHDTAAHRAHSSGPDLVAGPASARARMAIGAIASCIVLLTQTNCKPGGNKNPAPSATVEAPRDPRFDAEMIPSLEAPHFSKVETGGVVLDGILDEPIWKKAARTGPFVDVGSGKVRRDLPVTSEARVFYDDDFLYVAFEVQDATIHGGFPTDALDPHLWERDTVEIMLDPEGDGDNKDYYEIQVNPQNLVFDSHFDDYNLPRGGPSGPFGHEDWKSGLSSGVKLNGSLDDDSDRDNSYFVEAKIPWRSFRQTASGPPMGKTWRVNFYAMKDNGGVGWSPILGQGNFHKASRFGRLRFAGND